MTPKTAYQSIAHLLPLFHQPWWLDAVCAGNWDVAILKEQEKILAVWPYQVEKKWGFRLLRNPPFTPYLGPLSLSEKPLSENWVEDLYRQLPKVHFAQWTCLPEFTQKSFVHFRNSKQQQRTTYCIELKLSEEELWQNMHPKRRNAIRKAQSDLIVQAKMMDVDDFAEWQKLAFDEKKNKYPYSAAFLKSVIDKASMQNASLNYSVSDKNGNELGQIWLAFDASKMYYLLSATPAQTHRGAIALLLWTAILESKKMGLETFDFEGSMDDGIAHFFHRFGGIKSSYVNYTITHSFLWQWKQKLFG